MVNIKKVITLGMIIFLLFPSFVVSADSRSYDIDDVTIEAVVNEDASVEVTEFLTYNFSGDYNGITRNIKLSGGNIEFESLSIIEGNKETIFEENNSTNENSYETRKNANDFDIKAYSKSSNEKKTFKICYKLDNIIYANENNIPMLNWKFYEVTNVPKINDATLKVSLKDYTITSDNTSYKTLKNSEMNTFYDEEGIVINYKDLKQYLSIELQLPTDYFTTTIGQPSKERNTHAVIIAAGIGIIILGAIVLICIDVKKFKKALQEYRAGYVFNSNVICNEPPSNLAPTVVSVIYNEGKAVDNDNIIPSTIFYLASIGVYTISNEGKISKKSLKIKVNPDIPIPVYKHISYFVNWFNEYAVNGEFSIDDINKKLRKQKNEDEFRDKLAEFSELIQEDCEYMFVNIGHRKVLTNEFKQQYYNWCAYKDFAEKQITERVSKINENSIDDIVVYAEALDIEYEEVKKLCSKMKKYNQNNLSVNSGLICPYYYYYYSIIATSSNRFNPSSYESSGGFDGGFGSSGFSGGGGGGSGAF